MKKVLIFCAGGHGAQEGLQIEEAIEQYKQGNDVTFLSCDESVGVCRQNLTGDKSKCKICKYLQNKNRKRYLPKHIKQISVSSLLTENIGKEEYDFQYTNSYELRDIKFHGVEIGLATLSTYISDTRDLDPIINEKSKPLFDGMLKSQVKLTEAIEKIHKQEKFNLFIVHNGRFSVFKPMLNIAQRESIDYICTEVYQDEKGVSNKDYYYNNTPHNISPITEKYFQAWESALIQGYDRFTIGREFFERRRNAQDTGDKIYTINQDKSIAIDNWNESLENIVIFNSSEDEFFAVSGDYEKQKIFSSQIEGIKSIIEHYINDKTKHFYLRIHPNLNSLPYNYHLDLYKLDYPNLTIIGANSPISSYCLLDNADKVITFGSTMGIEASYAKKPSITIGASLYAGLDVTYQPRSIEEIWNLIDNKNLPHKYSENVLVYGHYYMGTYKSLITNHFNHIDNNVYWCTIINKHIPIMGYNQIWNSCILYILITRLIFRTNKLFHKIQGILKRLIISNM